MRYQYQGVPTIPPALNLSLGSGSITSAKAGTKYLWLQYRNRAGYSAVSSVSSISVAAGQKIVVTIPTGAKPAAVGGVYGVDIQEYVVLLSESNDISTAVTVATFPGYQSDGTPYALPANIDLNQDDHLAISSLTVANEASLPASPIHGMRRAIASPSRFVAYDAVFAPTGWKDTYPQVFSTYVPDTTEANGCDVSIIDISDTAVILTPDYAVDGTASKTVGFWLANNESNPIPSGTRIGLSFDLDNVDVSSQFIGLASIIFQGYVNKTTGELDTSSMVVNTAIPYSGAQTGMVLQKALPVNSAVLLQVRLEFRPFQLKNRPVQGSVLRASPYLYADFAQYNADSSLLGSFIAAEYDRRRILPDSGANSAKALKGSGTISLSSGGGYTFQAIPESRVSGLEANTANQKVFIAINGSLYVAATTIEGAVLRAIVGTVDGIGHIKGWSGSYALTASNLLQIVVTYPLNISPNYPDVIAGSGSGYFNPSGIRFFVRPVGGGTIRYFDSTVLAGVSQTFTIGLSGTETEISSLPSNPAANFGLYRATDASYAIAPISGSSVFATGNYEVAIAFIFNGRVTSISHSPLDGCVLEADSTIGELFEKTKYNRTPVVTLANLRAISSTTIPNLQECIVASLKWSYQYQNDSYLVDDTTNTSDAVKPNDLESFQSGRWIRLQRFGIGNITLGVDEFDYAMTLTDSNGGQNINLKMPRGLRGLTGPTGERGETGTVGNNTGIVITDGSPPSTSELQIALYYQSDVLRLRNASNGTFEQIATLNRVQSFTRAQAIAPVILADATIIAVDASLSNNFRILLNASIGSTRTLENPINLIGGQQLSFLIEQPAGGGCAVTFGSKYRFVGSSVIKLGAGERSLVTCYYDNTSDLLDCLVWGTGSGSGTGKYQLKTSDFTAEGNKSYLVTTSTKASVTLPSGATEGDFLRFKNIGSGKVVLFIPDSTQLYTLKLDSYIATKRSVELIYTGSQWIFDQGDILYGVEHGLLALFFFSTATPLAAEFNAFTQYFFVDTGSTPLTFTAGALAPYAPNFDNASAGYRIEFSFTDLASGVFAIAVNCLNNSSNELIISSKIVGSSDYFYSLRAIDSTHIRFTLTTSTSSYILDATVANAYTQNLIIMTVDFNNNRAKLKVNNNDELITTISGSVPSFEALVVGQETAGSQFTGVIDRVLIYWRELYPDQEAALWNNGSFS